MKTSTLDQEIDTMFKNLNDNDQIQRRAVTADYATLLTVNSVHISTLTWNSTYFENYCEQ